MKKGFTLIELLVVISIISLLSTIVMSSLSTARMKARDVKRMQDLKQIQIALELYRNDHDGKYPVSLTSSLAGTWFTALGDPLKNGGYLSILPIDPLNVSPYAYFYQSAGACSTSGCYNLFTRLEDPNSPYKCYPNNQNLYINNLNGASLCPTGGSTTNYSIYSTSLKK